MPPAEEVVDAEDLRFVERSLHLRVELDRALEVGPERFLHDHPGVLDELRLPQHVDYIERGGGRHAEVVQPQAALAKRSSAAATAAASVSGPADLGT